MLSDPTRRAVLGALGATVASSAFVASPALAAVPKSESLATLASRRGLLFGASIASEINDDPAYAALYAQETSIVTTDVALKFDFLRPRRDVFAFDAADDLLAFSRRNGLRMRGHNLAWNDNAPDWLKRLSGSEITRVFDQHIDTVVGRYAGALHSWDVVNEPFWPGHDKPGGYRDGPWLQAMGPDYIRRAFARTYAIDKQARLTLNEAQCENNRWGQDIRPRLLALVDRLLDAGVPLHAVGLQAHLQPKDAMPDDAFLRWLEDLASRKVDIYITELDVYDASFPDDRARRDAAVAATYASFLGHVLRLPQVKMVVTWQLADRYSWYRHMADAKGERAPRPLPFDDKLARKPAYDAIAQAFRERDPLLGVASGG